MQKIGGPVDRIDDPALTLEISAFDRRVLFGEKPEIGARESQLLAQNAVGADIGLADEITRPFARDLEFF